MDDALKKTLLERKLSSIEYMEEMRDYHQASLNAMVAAIRYFYAHPPKKENWKNWELSEGPVPWEDRAASNFQNTQNGINEGIDHAQKGDLSYIKSAAGELHAIFRNLDNMGRKWWDYTDPALKSEFQENLVAAKKRASLIWYTTAGHWDADEILDEEITGPIDEKDLLRYLKPGESP